MLYSLSGPADGTLSASPLLVDPAGVIYGATYNGGDLNAGGGNDCGVAFSLAP